MFRESSAELDREDSHSKLTDIHELLPILAEKASYIQSQIKEFTNNTEDNSHSLTKQIKDISSIFIENKNYLNSEKIFKDDLSKFYNKLNIILDIYKSSSLSKVSPNYKKSLITKLSKDIDNFNDSLSIFLSNITDITNRISEITSLTEPNHDQELEWLDLRLGLECYLFNYCVYVEKKDEFPFFKSNFVTIYHYYNEINNITDKISLIDSYCGTGKTTCIPIILFIKNLKEGNKSPFILSVMKDPYHVKSLMNMFEKSNISIFKYVNITDDIEELEEIYKNYKNNQKGQNLTFGLLTTYNFLPLMHKLEDNEYFIPNTRFIIDQISQKTCHISVIISRILELSQRTDLKPLNFVLLSYKFPIEIINFLSDSAKVTTLVKEPLYEIREEEVEFCESSNKEQSKQNKKKKLNIFKQSDKRIKRAIKRTLFRMAEPRNKDDETFHVEEGNVLVFLPDTEQCRKLQYEMIKTNFDDKTNLDDKNNTKKKIFIVNITPKPHENYNSFLNRLTKIIDENEKKQKKKEEKEKKEKEEKREKELKEKSVNKDEEKEKNVNEEMEKNDDKEKDEEKEKSVNKEMVKNENDEKEEKKGNNVQFLYFVPFYVSGVTDEKINKIIRSEFPPYLKNVKKLIFSTSFTETLNINDLSVVIDRGLIKEEIFIPSTGLSKFIVKLASTESRNLRKGRLGRLKKGLYISFIQKDVKIDNIQTPSIQIHDLTKNYLMMKQVNIDLAKMNLIYKPNEKNLETAIKTLIDIDAIDKNSFEITDFGNEILKFNFIPIQYAAAVVKYSKSFDDEEKRKCAYFFSAYISLIITNAKLLIKDEKPDKLLYFFDDDSDIVTLFNALNSILKECKFNKKQKRNKRNNNNRKSATPSQSNSIDFDSINQTPSLSNSMDFDSMNQTPSLSNSMDFDSMNQTPSLSNSIDYNYNNQASSMNNSIDTDYYNQTPSLSNSIDYNYNNQTSSMNSSIDLDNTSQTSNQSNDDQKLNSSAEKYGFHPFKIKKLIKNLRIISDYLFPGKNSTEITNELSLFIEDHNIYEIIDDFIKNMNDKWKKIHFFDFKIARLTKTEKKPELVFLGNEELIFNDNKGQTRGKVFLTKRPGWKGLIIPSQCYIFDININNECQSYQKYVGHLIHCAKKEKQEKIQKAFDAIELKSRYIFNPWFNVLLESYFSDDIKNNTNISDVISFYPSRISNKIFLSFINNDKMKEQIKDAVNYCVKLLPFTPRSVLIYKKTPKSQGSNKSNEFIETITEIKSIGSFDYNSMDSTFCRGSILDKKLILHCINNLNEITLVDAKIRICSLFVNDTCDPSEYDTKNLYVIDMLNENVPGIGNLKDAVKETYDKMKDKIKKKKNEVLSSKNPVKYGNFQFSPRLVNPTLFKYEKSKENVMEWFHQIFPTVYVKEIRNHNLKMKISDIHFVQDKIDKNLIDIESNMNLDYFAISFPLEIKEIIINEHKDWYVYIDEKHNTMISPKEKFDEIKNFIKEKRSQSKSKKAASYFAKIGKLPSFCYNACADPDNSKLTDSPITYYFENGETYTSKLCQSCIYSSLCYATQRFYTNDKTNSDYLFQIKKRPSYILKIPSEFNENGTKCWPQVPLGQLISVLFDNDDIKLTSILSAYLRSINDYTMRYKMQKWLTFCPQHFDKFYEINENELKCSVPGCQNFYCNQCKKMHINVDHEEDVSNNKCQSCGWPYVKEEGCDIIECPYCGRYFCYLCGDEFESYCEANTHLLCAHPRSSYSIEYEENNFY